MKAYRTTSKLKLQILQSKHYMKDGIWKRVEPAC